ncbi:hypothetical protein F3Y22_tig00111105pilonHSYRG00622 [Hibiscus syriacus]|uniref:DUF4283 domain-containing protein n=1 Tax=Hibiscus syriacus TaxID=106335 RepID=A0A6A2Z1C3_HIBSY|nr:hypothetical protein F3Y22_tig00111105pilonHSYRG00622 [Hibiscus syriacus]
MNDVVLDQASNEGENKLCPTAKPSFRDMVAGKVVSEIITNPILDLDMELSEGDVDINLKGSILEIRFLDKDHHFIDEKLLTSVIVRLLGKKIGFALEEDYDNVLTGGPWMTYGSYLTVQSWSRDFSTSEDHSKSILVWLRLPGLPYRYQPVEYEGITSKVEATIPAGPYGPWMQVVNGRKNVDTGKKSNNLEGRSGPSPFSRGALIFKL